MQAYTIREVRKFMSVLLASNVFDGFEVEECIIQTFVTFRIDGRFHPEFFEVAGEPAESVESGDSAEGESRAEGRGGRGRAFCAWEKLRPVCVALIKGHNTPLYMKFTLKKAPEDIPELEKGSDISAMIVNIIYKDGVLVVRSAVSSSEFTLDKGSEQSWDSYMGHFLSKAGLLE